jgi:hypothetical protein
MNSDVRTVELCKHDLPYEGECPDGNTHRPNGCSCLLCLCFEKKSLNLSNTEKRPNVLLRRPDGCNLE